MDQDPAQSLFSLSPTELEAFLNGPGADSPPSVRLNFENPPNHTLGVHILLISCISIVGVFVTLTTYTKVRHVRKLQWEDGTLFIPARPLVAL